MGGILRVADQLLDGLAPRVAHRRGWGERARRTRRCGAGSCVGVSRSRGTTTMDVDRILENARKASTEALLDRVTVYRSEMESAAFDINESELHARGVSRAEIDGHAAVRAKDGLSRHPDGTVVRCNCCERPAVEYRWIWHRLWGW